MDKQEFITKFNGAEAVLDMQHVDEVITGCIDRVHDNLVCWSNLRFFS